MIAAFIAEKMSAYIAGGIAPENAARFTRGELAAIYQGKHYSRDASGAIRVTPPPEDIPIEAARAKCDEALTEILKIYSGNGKAPENAPAAQEKSGFEKMAEYAGTTA
jgi:hypothetical protein